MVKGQNCRQFIYERTLFNSYPKTSLGILVGCWLVNKYLANYVLKVS